MNMKIEIKKMKENSRMGWLLLNENENSKRKINF